MEAITGQLATVTAQLQDMHTRLDQMESAYQSLPPRPANGD